MVAGGIRVASLGIQLIESAQKLSRFLDSVEDFPEEEQEMLTQLEILADILDENGSSSRAKATVSRNAVREQSINAENLPAFYNLYWPTWNRTCIRQNPNRPGIP